MAKNYKLLFNLTDGRTIDAGIVNIPNGEQGSLGSTGKSVYDLWKEISGNENKTFEDFLNTLKGTDGKDGTAGAPGSSGQDNYILDLDNQISEISCDKNGTILDTTFEPCTATIYAGNTIDTINTWQFSIKFNDIEISNGYFNKGQITLTSDIIATNIGWLNKDVNLIRFIASNTNYGIREAVYTIKKAKGTPIYSIISNYNYIKYYKALRIYEPTILRIFINKRENGILYSNYDVTKDNVKVYASIDELDYKELEYDSVNLSFDVETTISKNIRVKILDSTNYLYDFESFPLISDGIDGIDGNGIEYAFLLITDETVDISKIIAPTINVGTKTLFIEGWHEGNWLDNPPIMTAEKQRIAVSVLKSVNGTWNNSWSTPSLWAVYSKNGENGVGVVPKIVIDYSILKSDYSAITDWCVFNSYLSKEGEAVVVTNWGGLGNPSHLITLSDASNTDCSKKFLDCGVFSGTTGTNAYVHVAYANISSYSCDSSGNQSGTILESNTLSPISSDGTPYKYIGIITDSTPKDPDITIINNYKWTKFSGDDGNGYYYSYTYSTLETNGPTAPTYSSTTNSTTGLNEADTNHLLNGFTWFDNVIAPTTDRKIIWQTWMKTDNPVWSTPVIWNRYVTDGTTITSTKIEYAIGTSGTTYPADGWQSTIPSVSAGSYLWTRTTVNYSDGNSTVSYTVSRQANDGAGTSVTINSTSVTYAISDTSTQPADSEFKFSSIPSGLTIGLYLWNKTTITYSDSTVLTSYSVARIAADGATGKGLHLAYANSANGSKDFSVKYFSGAMYIGTCVNAEEADPPGYSSYTWSRLLGEDGKDSASLIFIFYRNSSQITSWLDADNPSKWTVTTDGEYIPTDSHWTSNPLGVDIEHMYEYVSTRKSTVTNGKATWGNYSEPVIWSHYGQDSSASTGIRVWTENDNITLSCKSTGTNYVATKTIEIRATNNGENLDISSVALGSTITGVSISNQAAKTGYYEIVLSLAEDSYNANTDTPGNIPLVVTISNITYNVYITLSGVIGGKQGDPGSTGPAGTSYDIKVNKNNITVDALGTIKNDSTQVWLNINDVKYYSNGLDSSGKSHNYKFYGVSGTNITAITTETFNLSSIIGKTTELTSDDFVTLYVTDNVALNSSKSNYIDYETLEVVADGKEGAAADGYSISTDNDRIGINTDTEGKSIALSESAKKVTFHVWHNSTEIAPTTITVANNPDTNATITLPTTYSATGNTVTIDYATGILANTLNEVITFNITFTKEDNTTTTRTATISLIGMRVGASGHSYSLKTSSSVIKITKTSSRTPTTIKAWLVDNNTKITSFTGDYAYWKIVYSTENNTSTAATLWDLTTAVSDSGITTSDISTNTLIFYLLYSKDKTSAKAVIVDSENIEFVLDGINAAAYDLVPDYNVIKITKDGTITPTTITATVNKITGTTVESNNTECVVTYSLDGATEVSSCPAYTASNKYVKIIAKLNGTEVDNETIPILLDGSDNYYLDLDNENITIAVDSTGSVIAGQFPIIVTPHFYKGITELSNLSFTFAGNGDVTFSQSGDTITGTIATINNLNSATANIKISIVINSVTYSKNLKILLAVPGPNGVTYYTWIKYADSVGSDGYPTSIYDTPKSATNYIGISYNNLVKESDSSDSSIISHYTWIKIKGENGTSFSAKGKADKHFTSYINASASVSVGTDVIYLFDKGDNDTAVTSAGILTVKSNLQSISYPSDGDAYVTDDSHIWVKDGNSWIDLGMIKGDKGDPGTDADYYQYYWKISANESGETVDSTSMTQDKTWIPTGWSSTVVSVTSTNRFLWQTRRLYTGSTKTFGTCETPQVVGVYGPAGPTTVLNLSSIIIRFNDSYNNGIYYFNGDSKSDSAHTSGSSNDCFKYKDIVYYEITTNNITHGAWFTPKYDAIIASIPGTYANSKWTVSDNWILYNFVDAEYINDLIANNAYVNNLTAKDVVIVDSNGKPEVGLTGSTSNYSKYGISTYADVRIWAGLTDSTNLNTAAFYVTNTGHVHAEDIDATGIISANLFNFIDNLTVNTKAAYFATTKDTNGNTVVNLFVRCYDSTSNNYIYKCLNLTNLITADGTIKTVISSEKWLSMYLDYLNYPTNTLFIYQSTDSDTVSASLIKLNNNISNNTTNSGMIYKYISETYKNITYASGVQTTITDTLISDSNHNNKYFKNTDFGSPITNAFYLNGLDTVTVGDTLASAILTLSGLTKGTYLLYSVYIYHINSSGMYTEFLPKLMFVCHQSNIQLLVVSISPEQFIEDWANNDGFTHDSNDFYHTTNVAKSLAVGNSTNTTISSISAGNFINMYTMLNYIDTNIS